MNFSFLRHETTKLGLQRITVKSSEMCLFDNSRKNKNADRIKKNGTAKLKAQETL